MTRGRRSLVEWAARAELPPGENLLVLVDQFEELFRYADYAAREEAEDFVALLLESSRQRDMPIHVVITMRSEYLGACALISGLAETVNNGFYLTPRMSREECRQAIEGPAAVTGFDIEPALTNRILNDMASLAPWEQDRGVAQGQILSRRADQLPMMQHLLNRLWIRASERTHGGRPTLTITDYEQIGGLNGALDAHGAAVMATLSRSDVEKVGTIFRALVSGPDTTNAVRRPCQFSELQAEITAGGDGDPSAAARIVEAFRAPGCNFLQPANEIPLDATTLVDISHESLIRQWTLLSGWLNDETRADASWHRLLIATERYESGDGDLLTGRNLSELRRWWDTEHPTEAWAARHGGRYAEARCGRGTGSHDQARATRTAAADRHDRRRQYIAAYCLGRDRCHFLARKQTDTRCQGQGSS